MSLPTVVIADFTTDVELERKVLESAARVVALGATHEEQVREGGGDADVLIVFHDVTIGKETIGKLSRLRGVVRCGVGYDNVDRQAAGQRGILVCNVPDYGTEEVADHALMSLLAITRRLPLAMTATANGQWNSTVIQGAPRLRGRTLGIIGCGRIGSAMALRAKPIGLRVVIYDPYQPPGLEKALGVERVDRLEDLLAQADIVSLHCPLTPETRHMINDQTLSHMKNGAYLVNTARGGCVDSRAVVRALDSGRLAFAALDVIETEPPPEALGVVGHPRILLTPHAAYYSVEGYIEMRTKAAKTALAMLTGQPVQNCVNRPWLKNPQCPLPAATFDLIG